MQRQKFVVKTQQSKTQQPQAQQQQQASTDHQFAMEHEAELIETEALEYELTEDLEPSQSQEELHQQLLNDYQVKLAEHLDKSLAESGYKRPPEPSPFLKQLSVQLLAGALEKEGVDPLALEALKSLKREIELHSQPANEYLKKLQKSLAAPSALKRIQDFIKGVDKSIDSAQVTIEMPTANPALQQKMQDIELFLAGDWDMQEQRGVVAVHVDEATKTTILQIGLAPYGCVYITIPAVLSPEDKALLSLRAMFGRLAPFVNIVDPMAVINGEHQRLNYNEVFPNVRVMRAPSGNTARLARNIAATAKRARLSVDNTVILNSTPASVEEYVRVFPEDAQADHWGAWDEEAQRWTTTTTANDFAAAQEISRETVLNALTQQQNVIVVVAHCDGESIFLPQPPPAGSLVTADYLLEHKDEIAANAPFVYLFSCEAGDLTSLRNFASTLLECGASGVIASQSNIGSAEGRKLLNRVLNEERGAPPIADYYNAMNEVNYRDMEVFLG